jgi:hypothetical protein
VSWDSIVHGRDEAWLVPLRVSLAGVMKMNRRWCVEPGGSSALDSPRSQCWVVTPRLGYRGRDCRALEDRERTRRQYHRMLILSQGEGSHRRLLRKLITTEQST